MTQLHETAYPRLKADPSAQDLDEIYTLTPDEIRFIDKTVKRPIARSAAFIYLKLFQRLGYFVHIRDVPAAIRQHIVVQTGHRPARADELRQFDRTTARTTLIAALRRYLNVRPLDDQGRAWLRHVGGVSPNRRKFRHAKSEPAADTRMISLFWSWSALGRFSALQVSRQYDRRVPNPAVRCSGEPMAGF